MGLEDLEFVVLRDGGRTLEGERPSQEGQGHEVPPVLREAECKNNLK